MVFSSSENELMKLHLDFWNHNLKDPIIANEYSFWRRINFLFHKRGWVLHEDFVKMGEDATLEPDILKPGSHHDYYEYNEFGNDRICGPVFNTIIPWTMITWLPAIAGCELKVSVRGDTIWPMPYIEGNWFEDENMGLKINYKWLDKLLEFTDFLVGKYSPRRMVSLEMFSRGPGDLLINSLGERAYLEMYDHPAELKKLLSILADIHIKWSGEQLKRIPKLNNGYCNQWGIWAPGKVTRIQEDFAVNLSEKHFREFLEPAEIKIIQASEFQVFHTHSGLPSYAEWISKIEGLKVVEMTIDPISPPVEELIPLWKRILEKKSLIITGTLNEKQVESIISKLDVSGLFLDIEMV
jgi:hypothetical protein